MVRSLGLVSSLTLVVGLAYGQSGLLPKKFTTIPLGGVRPSGWLADQLDVQMNGLAGHEHEFYNYVAQTDWMGGPSRYSTLEEAGSYWFNAAIPAAVLAKNDAILTRAQEFLDYVISHQEEGGWLGPEAGKTNATQYPRYPFMFGAIQMVEYDPSQTDKVVTALHKFVEEANRMLHAGEGMEIWTQTRWADFVMSLEWLYDFHPNGKEDLLIDTMKQVKYAGVPWEIVFTTENFPTTAVDDLENPTGYVLSWHGVNLAEGIKALPAAWRFTHNESDLTRTSQGWDLLFKYHGRPSGCYAADEYLAGLEASRGTELCSIVEMMFSSSYLFQIMGDLKYLDRAERMAYNSLPATITAGVSSSGDNHYLFRLKFDFYDRSLGSPIRSATKPDRVQEHDARSVLREYASGFLTFGGRVLIKLLVQRLRKRVWAGTLLPVSVHSNTRSLKLTILPRCCTVNHPQGWPKFISHSFLTTGDGSSLAQVYHGPIQTTVTLSGNNKVSVDVETTYPFSDIVSTSITADSSYTHLVRIPSWVVNGTVSINGGEAQPLEPHDGFHSISVPAGKTTFVLNLPAEITTEARPHGAVAFHRGPLHYALDISFNAHILKQNAQEPRAADYQFDATSDWQFAIDPKTAKWVGGASPTDTLPSPIFDSGKPPVSIEISGCSIDWAEAGETFAAPPPQNPACKGEIKTLKLIPYGATKLRIGEFPVMST
ncbi:hypothetical protein V5O48_011940 [Marasmius crinis-equi]|uniref:Uncharacterized protein n=1 Tax=Marasmius crinis-equi TaxID=585013 RepID=A0ABR3F4G7_9AGAR